MSLPPPLRTGDQIATRGTGLVSTVIAAWTGLLHAWRLPWTPNVSHTAIVVEDGGRLLIYESTSLAILPDAHDGKLRVGVQCHDLDDYLAHYPGKIWHLPLTHEARARFDADAARGYWQRRHRDQVAYDRRGAIASATPLPSRPIHDTETGKPLYCTAYLAYGLSDRYGGLFPLPGQREPGDERAAIAPWDVYPKDALRWPFYGEPVRLK